MMKSVSKSVRSTAYHEAGHAFVACYFRLATHSISIEPEKGESDGHVRYQNPLAGVDLNRDYSDEARFKVEKLMIICFAGPAAQRYYNPKGVRKYHAEHDMEIVDKLMMRFAGGSKETMKAHHKWLSLRALDIVSNPEYWQTISNLAEALIERGSLNKEEIHKLVYG
jgi:hypothetical protein